MNSEEIGKQIANLRKARGYSQKEFAEMISISQPALSRWERGAVIPPLQQLEHVCEILDISFDQTFGDEKTEYKKFRAKISRLRIAAIILSTSLLIALILIFIPKYKVISEGEVYSGMFGETIIVYVKPLLFQSESSAESYGKRVAKAYEDRIDLEAVEVIFVKTARDIEEEDSEYFSNIYILHSISN